MPGVNKEGADAARAARDIGERAHNRRAVNLANQVLAWAQGEPDSR